MAARDVAREGCLIVLVVVTVFASPSRAAGFEPPCPLPYDSIKQHHPIDDTCDSTGTAGSPKVARQDGAKNNFCAAGPAAVVTQLSFKNLQAKAAALKVPFGGQGKLPPEPSVLHDIYRTSDGALVGEGSLVEYVGFILHSKYSDTGTGETCNCQNGGDEDNDIHISLAPTKSATLCASVVAEMSPHFRPDRWDTTDLEAVKSHPVRITGQLFFDSVHAPCTKGHPASPPRVSLWEIHPVYSCDVCKHTALADCPASDESVWEPLDRQQVVVVPNH